MMKGKQLAPESPLAKLLTMHQGIFGDGFITRLDRSSVYHKRCSFAKGLATNIFIIACFGWLAAIILKHELATPLPYAFKTTICLTQYILIAWAVVTILLSTSFPFFFGECRRRLIYGFKPVEIVIRSIPRHMHAGLQTRDGADTEREQHGWKSILRSIDSRLVFYNPLAFLSEDFWSLDYNSVMHACRLLKEGSLDEADFEFALWRLEQGLWTSHEAWRMHVMCIDEHTMTLIKRTLVRQGKEKLFTRWQSTLQTEPDARRAYCIILETFVREGIDYEEFWSQLYDIDISSNVPCTA